MNQPLQSNQALELQARVATGSVGPITKLSLDEIIAKARLEKPEGMGRERLATALRAISW